MAIVTSPTYYRWCDAMRQRCPTFPDEVLALYYPVLEAGEGLTIDDVAQALTCDAATAAYWHSMAVVWLMDPYHYEALFQAEDVLADLRTQRTQLQADIKGLEERLEALDHEIAVSRNYALLSPEHAAEMQPRIEELDGERVDILRRLDRDVPRQRQLLDVEERAVAARLQAAKQAIDEAWNQQVTLVQQTWLAEALERCTPVLETLRKCQTLTEALKALGRDREGYSAILDASVRRLQGRG